MEELRELLVFAVEDATLSYDIDNRPIIDENKLLDILLEVIYKRERRMKTLIKKESQEAIKKILQEI